MSITVYTKPNCPQCVFTKRELDKLEDAEGNPLNLEYTTIDITEDAEARAYVMDELGYLQAPVVVVDADNHWSGFSPDKIKALAPAKVA